MSRFDSVTSKTFANPVILLNKQFALGIAINLVKEIFDLSRLGFASASKTTACRCCGSSGGGTASDERRRRLTNEFVVS
jgi:hypothetical protein